MESAADLEDNFLHIAAGVGSLSERCRRATAGLTVLKLFGSKSQLRLIPSSWLSSCSWLWLLISPFSRLHPNPGIVGVSYFSPSKAALLFYWEASAWGRVAAFTVNVCPCDWHRRVTLKVSRTRWDALEATCCAFGMVWPQASCWPSHIRVKMPVMKGLLAPQNTFLDTIATRFDGTRKYPASVSELLWYFSLVHAYWWFRLLSSSLLWGFPVCFNWILILQIYLKLVKV